MSYEKRYCEGVEDSLWYRYISFWNKVELTRIGFSQGNRIKFVARRDTDHKHNSVGEESVLCLEWTVLLWMLLEVDCWCSKWEIWSFVAYGWSNSTIKPIVGQILVIQVSLLHCLVIEVCTICSILAFSSRTSEAKHPWCASDWNVFLSLGMHQADMKTMNSPWLPSGCCFLPQIVRLECPDRGGFSWQTCQEY